MTTNILDNNYITQNKELYKNLDHSVLLKPGKVNKFGDLSNFLNLRKLTISFNSLNDLSGIEQLSQLRYLSAYCCGITTFESINDNKKLEYLFLQQNAIKEIPFSLRGLIKLKELRLDRNKIFYLENLHTCITLKYLDLSWNKIDSIDGLAGLQSLVELKLNNNLIKSIKGIRALPSLKELQVSYNFLKSLDGIQNIPTLEIIRADHNEITTLKIPQTYNSERKIEKNQNQTNSNETNALSSQNKFGMTELNDVFLSHNKLHNLVGIDTLGEKLETLDISFNCIDDSKELNLLVSNRSLINLYLAGNSVVNESSDLLSNDENSYPKELYKELLIKLNNLEYIDDINMETILPEVKSIRQQGKEFYTWKSDELNDVNEKDIEIDKENTLLGSEDIEKTGKPSTTMSDVTTIEIENVEKIESVFKNLINLSKDKLKSSDKLLD
jgi:Leucine-rich repeat (LRR) protein